MDTELLYSNIKGVSDNILACYKELSYLDKKGMSSSLEYEKCLKAIESLTKMEDYYYDIIFQNEECFGKFIDYFLDSFDEKDFKTITTGQWLLLFKKYDDNILVGYRIFNNVTDKVGSMGLSRLNDITGASDMVNYITAKKNKIFLDLISDVYKDSECGSYKDDMCDALYDFAFINKKDDNEITKPKEGISIANGEDIELLEKLLRKISKLTEERCSLPSNFRSIALNICYLRSLLITLPREVCLGALANIVNDENTDRNSYGFTSILRLLESMDEYVEKYDEDDYSLKRKF